MLDAPTQLKVSLLAAYNAAYVLASKSLRGDELSGKTDLYRSAVIECLDMLEAAGSYAFMVPPGERERVPWRCPGDLYQRLTEEATARELPLSRIASCAVRDYCDRRLDAEGAQSLSKQVRDVMDAMKARARAAVQKEIDANRVLRRR